MPTAISLIPSATEIVVALGAADRLVAVSEDCRHVEGVPELPVISRGLVAAEGAAGRDAAVRASDGPLYGLDTELVSRLWPDVVFTQDSCWVCALPSSALVEAFAATGRPSPDVVSLDPGDLGAVLDTFEIVAAALGLEGEGERLRDHVQASLDGLPRRRLRPRVLVLDWPVPAFSAGNWVAELVEAAGGVAVASEPGVPSHEIDLEAALATADAVVVAPCGLGLDEATECARNLRGASGGASRWCALDGRRFFSRPGPGLVAGAAALSSWLRGGELASPIGAEVA